MTFATDLIFETVVRAFDSAKRHTAPGVEEERGYFVHRADAELEATLRASCIEAEMAHNVLTGEYLTRCRDCAPEHTEVCVSSGFIHVCETAPDLIRDRPTSRG